MLVFPLTVIRADRIEPAPHATPPDPSGPPGAEARRVLRPGGLFAACAPNRDSDPELARVVPGWGAASPFDGEDAESIVASVFADPGDTAQAERWDGLRLTLSSVPDAAACLRVYGLSEAAAADTAATLDLPLTLTKRGCIVYATKAAWMSRPRPDTYGQATAD